MPLSLFRDERKPDVLFWIPSNSSYMQTILKRALIGAVAGAVGAIAMKRFESAWSKLTRQAPELGVFGLETSVDIETAQQIWKAAFKRSLDEQEAANIGAAMHYGMGILTGSAYCVIAPEQPVIRLGGGTAFGAALWLVADEFAVSASRLSDPFAKHPLSHVSALAAHLIYGVALELGGRVIDRSAAETD
jgi:putative membrane protein